MDGWMEVDADGPEFQTQLVELKNAIKKSPKNHFQGGQVRHVSLLGLFK